MSDAKIERIRAMGLFGQCDDAHLKHIAELADEVTVSPGHVLTEQGSNIHHLYVVVSGRGDVVMDGEKVGEADPGETIGEVSLFDQGPASATVTAPAIITRRSGTRPRTRSM